VPINEDERITPKCSVGMRVGRRSERGCARSGDPRHLTGQDGGTPLTEQQHEAMPTWFNCCLIIGANVNAATKAGDTALHLAAQGGSRRGHPPSGRQGVLISRFKNGRGLTSLTVASAKSNPAFAGEIIRKRKLKPAAQLLAQLGAKE